MNKNDLTLKEITNILGVLSFDLERTLELLFCIILLRSKNNINTYMLDDLCEINYIDNKINFDLSKGKFSRLDSDICGLISGKLLNNL